MPKHEATAARQAESEPDFDEKFETADLESGRPDYGSCDRDTTPLDRDITFFDRWSDNGRNEVIEDNPKHAPEWMPVLFIAGSVLLAVIFGIGFFMAVKLHYIDDGVWCIGGDCGDKILVKAVNLVD